MKAMRVISKSLFYLGSVISVFIFSTVIYLNGSVGSEFKVKKGGCLKIASPLPVTAVYNGVEVTSSTLNTVGANYDVDLKIFGTVPLSTVSVEVVDEMQVAVSGRLFGMKLYTDGVLVTEVSRVVTDGGAVNPAQEAGIKKGDYIISVNGKEIHTNEELGEAVEKSDGEPMSFLIKRNGSRKNVSVKPMLSKESRSYKIGIWVRDSSAGIGTLTFYSPSTDIICGLGHGICDEDTESLLEINDGRLVNAELISVEKGEKGNPGKLCGKFGIKSIGNIELNCALGVYSKLSGSVDTSKLTEIAPAREIKSGKAQIYCTVQGDDPEYFDCTVEVRSSAITSETKNMLVTVTDKRLLDITGGIVQGMSGAPIIQNGRLIGAVTHVCVNL